MTDENTGQKPQKSLKPLIALNALLFFGVIFIIAMTMGAFPDKTPPEKMPEFGMESIEGEAFGNANLQGDVMIINLFASWCTPCLAEHPVLMDIAANVPDLPIYGIAVHDKREDLQFYLTKHGNPFDGVGMDYAGLMSKGLEQDGVPLTLIIDKDMKIHWLWLGPITPSTWEERMVPVLTQLGVEI